MSSVNDFQMWWLDQAIKDWEKTKRTRSFRTAWVIGTYSGLCSYFLIKFGYDIGEVFREVGLDDKSFLWPAYYCSSNNRITWKEHAEPRVKFLKHMREELNKMGYKS